MTIITQNIICANSKLTLTNQRAVFWENGAALILSDLHIGKTAHFRKSGIAVPTDVLHRDLLRLTQLIDYFNAKILIVVGDLFHAGVNSDLYIFREWLSRWPLLQVVLVKGNHDRVNKKVVDQFSQIAMVKRLEHDPFLFVHQPQPVNCGYFAISGHTHPGVLIKGKGKQRIKLPCYQVGGHQLILPAFSLFTGLNTQTPMEKHINYAFTENAIFNVNDT